jgi:hypothetical protein
MRVYSRKRNRHLVMSRSMANVWSRSGHRLVASRLRLVEEARSASGPAAGVPVHLGEEATEASMGRRRPASGGGGRR